ncbi:MAG: sugar ABC transporter ATP-binding protein, partial [Prolixibacteraceae bacterium]|nr:sugar ABC transporter ATP-binding protein [Prolixibacteraceae bacterium]
MDKQIQAIPILEVKNVSKDFSGVYALKNVDLQIYTGEVTAIIGENGAGKSTLMKIISGVHPDYEGEILLNGKVVTFKNPKEAAEKGIVIIHQELNLIPHLSITENLYLGQELTNALGLLDYQKMHKKSKELLELLKLEIDPRIPVNQLRVGQQQLIEIARALLFDSKVLIMDEPTSAISDSEVELLFSIIKELTAKGVAIVYISHKLNELFKIAQRFEVLRDGEKVGNGIIQETNHETLIKMMVGRDLTKNSRNAGPIHKEEILRVENLSFLNPENKTTYLVNNISFTLHKGEVLGIAGLMGAGRTELLEALFGMHPKSVSGEIFIENKKMKIQSVHDAVHAGLGLVPEDRKLQGLILNMNVEKNSTLASLEQVSKFGFLSKKKEEQLSSYYIKKMNTKVASPKMGVQKLSGGNQQKVVIAKWLATNPKILLLDEPTRGIDVGAKSE